MARDSKYDKLFEPIQIGPKTLRNRFWQVPHCNGAGSDRPGMQAEFRAMKAEGGWGAVFTEVCNVNHAGDILPWVGSKLCDAGDVRNLALMCDRIHENGGLAGVELLHSGGLAGNAESRAPTFTVSQIPHDVNFMANGRAMDRDDIRALRREHVEGALRAREAGFDLISLFCGLGTFPIYFLYPFYNRRTDEYGGSFENRIRFTVELLEEMRSAIDDVAIGARFSIDTLEEPYGYGDLGVRAEDEGRRFIESLDHLVDFWDVNIGTLNWGEDAGSSRFFQMNHESRYARVAKQVSKKPVINVGRFTDPDVMLGALESGQCDIIGAARPSIADPFLPKKIEEGRFEDIRECIACNVCVSRWEQGGPPIWCTQNATSGEEYRRGWHPERFEKASNHANDVLVIGAGPAGLECAMVLGKRGMRRVHLLDAEGEVGGHLRWVTKLPGLGTWSRVIQYRQTQIGKLKNVEFIPNAPLDLDAVLEYGAEIVIVATGSEWDGHGLNGVTHTPIDGVSPDAAHVLTPEQLVLESKNVGERVLVYDTDGYYMGATMAELLAKDGRAVTYVTAHDTMAPYMRFTLEEQRQYQRLVELGVEIVTQSLVLGVEPGAASVLQHWAGAERTIEMDTIMLTTQRNSRSTLYDQLKSDEARLAEAGIAGVYCIGDAWAPGMIAQSVFSGHRLAREIDSPDPATPLPFIRERRLVGSVEEDYRLDSLAIQAGAGLAAST